MNPDHTCENVTQVASPHKMFHGFSDALTKFLSSVFDDGVSRVLAGVLTGGDDVGVRTCLQGRHARVELMGLLGRGGRRNAPLSDVGWVGRGWEDNMAGHVSGKEFRKIPGLPSTPAYSSRTGRRRG